MRGGGAYVVVGGMLGGYIGGGVCLGGGMFGEGVYWGVCWGGGRGLLRWGTLGGGGGDFLGTFWKSTTYWKITIKAIATIFFCVAFCSIISK